jgi:DNA-binding transcriptional LysR family regulator
MEMRRLEALCKVIELKSFTKAAEALLLSQPTISEHIRILEEVVGEKLIDRLGREVLPTPAGRIFYQYARGILRMREDAVQALQEFKGNLSGHLILGASSIPGTYVLPSVMGSFKTAHPAIQVTLRISDSAQVIDEVLQGDVEGGMVGSKSNDRRLILEEIFSDELVLAVFPDHKWARKTRIRLDELAGEPFLSRERGSGTRTVMEKIIEAQGFDTSRLFVVGEMGSTEAIRQGVKARVGVSILSRFAIQEDLQYATLVVVEIDGVRFFRPLYLITRRNRKMSPLCSAFLDHLRTVIEDAGKTTHSGKS